MNFHPILFTGEMIRANLEGRKTQTRRVVMPQPESDSLVVYNGKCPYGEPGDVLWAREALRGDGQPGNRRVGIVRYGADGEMVLPCAGCGHVGCLKQKDCFAKMDLLWEWKNRVLPSIHMPKWACRLWCRVESVRVQRVQEISEADAKAEGVQRFREEFAEGTYRYAYSKLWDSINAKRGFGWKANPWVWAITYTPMRTGEHGWEEYCRKGAA